MTAFARTMSAGCRVLDHYSTEKLKLAAFALADTSISFDELRIVIGESISKSEGFGSLVIASALLALRAELEARDPGFAEQAEAVGD